MEARNIHEQDSWQAEHCCKFFFGRIIITKSILFLLNRMIVVRIKTSFCDQYCSVWTIFEFS